MTLPSKRRCTAKAKSRTREHVEAGCNCACHADKSERKCRRCWPACRCKQPRTDPTDKCRFHGGISGTRKHGLNSKYGPPPALAETIATFERDPKVLDHKHLGAHVYVLLQGALASVDAEKGITPDDFERLLPVLEALRKYATDFHRLAVDRRFVDLVEAREVIGRALHAVIRFVPDEKRREALNAVEEVLGGDEAVGAAAGSIH